MKAISKQQMIQLIRDSAISDVEKRAFLAELMASGEITEGDIAEAILEDIDARFDEFAGLFQEDEMLRFLWERFRQHPAMLARALVQARPDLFYTYGFAMRLIIKLRTELGELLITPRENGAGDGGSEEPVPTATLPQAVQRDLFRLDLECRFRDFLYFYSRDVQVGHELLEAEIDRAESPYDRSVLRAAKELAERLFAMPLPGIRTQRNGRPFPALHVRWWLDSIRDVERSLNIGDTGTYKTSFAALAMALDGRRRILTLVAPHAREAWGRELPCYFEEPPFVQIVRSESDLASLEHRDGFTVVAYTTLAVPGVVSKLVEHGFDGLIQDECHYGKNVNGTAAKRALACLELVRSLPLKKYVALSATPTENRPEELAALGVSLRPELFPNPETFVTSGAAKNPRLMRELFAGQILEIEAREIRELPDIRPKPWEDLFGAVAVTPLPSHQRLYKRILDEEQESSRKLMNLLKAAIHPPLLGDPYARPDSWMGSSKLVWLKRFIDERISTRKIVVATGLFAASVTHAVEDRDELSWIGGRLRAWYGEERVVCIDETVGLERRGDTPSPREEIVARWRSDPEARILLVSMQACPDSIDLSVPELPGVEGLAITSLSLGWKPWKQFLGRFWREGQGVPIEYANPILVGTIDEDLLRLNQEKWNAQLLFRAGAPITQKEWEYLESRGTKGITSVQRTAIEHVNVLMNLLRGKSESAAKRILGGVYGAERRSEALARHFIAVQNFSASGHIARFMRTVLSRWQEHGMVSKERILDAGCGPLTLERSLEAPVHGIDMNASMIETGRTVSAFAGRNARCGVLSGMPEEWTNLFEVSVASMVLDLTDPKPRPQGSERFRILRELVRVTDPHGLIWLTWNASAHTDESFESWRNGLTAAGAKIRDELTGRVEATDAPQHPFSFWSLVFTANGKKLRFDDRDAFRHAFEVPRRKKHIRSKHRETPPSMEKRFVHEHFTIFRGQVSVDDTRAADQAVVSELMRWSAEGLLGRKLHRPLADVTRAFSGDWRLLAELQRRGVIRF